MATDNNRSSATNENASGGPGFREVTDEARQSAKELGSQAREQARTTTEYLRQQADSALHDGKDQVAHQVEGLAQALRKSGEELRNQELGRLADGSDWLAGRIDELQHYLAEREPAEMLDDLRSAARRQPAWYLGGMFAAGLIAARFIKSGSDSRSRQEWHGSSSEQYRVNETTRT